MIAAALVLAMAPACSRASPGETERATAPASVLEEDASRRQWATLSNQGFLENRGQWPSDVLFFARLGGVQATLTADALVFRPAAAPGADGEDIEERPSPLVLRLPGAASHVEGEAPFDTRHHFLLADRSATDVAGYQRVLYRDVIPGIDVQLRTAEGAFEYDLLLDPGADLESFTIGVEGAERVEVLEDDRLAIHTASGVVEQRIGASWQVVPETGEREPVTCGFRTVERGGAQTLGIGFEAPGWDPRYALVLDPSLIYATYVGGSSGELPKAMAVDEEGVVYVTTKANDSTPTTPGSFSPAFNGFVDVWVGKISPDGTSLEWGTFLGGSNTDNGFGLGVDEDGSIVVVGQTWSSDFPTTAGALQEELDGISDIFVTRLDPTGSSLVWSTLYGGADHDWPSAAALFPDGDVLVAGGTFSKDLPATEDAFDTTADEGDLLLFRLSADGTEILFHTYFHTTRILDVAIDGEENVYFTGDVFLVDAPIPTTPGVFQEDFGPGGGQGYVAKLDPTGSDLLWSTYLGGEEGNESMWAIAVDAASAVYVGTQVSMDDYPVTPGAFEPSEKAGAITKLLPEATGLVWSTYFGGDGVGYVKDLAVDAAGNVHCIGNENLAPGWPVTPDAFQPFFVGPAPSSDVGLSKLDAFGEELVYSTHFGGNGGDRFPLLGLDGVGQPHFVFSSYSTDIPVTPGAYQPFNAGSSDLVLAAFDLPLLPWRVHGGGLKGATEIPNLAGGGELVPGSPTRLSLRGGTPGMPAWAVAGLFAAEIPLFDGTLYPFPHLVVPVGVLDADGALDLTFGWPTLPPGTGVYFQIWSLDPDAPDSWAATNAMQGITQ